MMLQCCRMLCMTRRNACTDILQRQFVVTAEVCVCVCVCVCVSTCVCVSVYAVDVCWTC